MEPLTLHSTHGNHDLCTTSESVDTANEFELGLHIAALFAILLTSTIGTPLLLLTNKGVLFPIAANRARALRIPSWVFFSVKHFGTGVIIATAFIHVTPLSEITDSSSSPAPFQI
jgi:solute carrier family 39 (zinc transporter), member 1/2/3